MHVLSMQNVSKTFGTHQVLKDISLTVDKGEAVSIIGPSGSGKSTLLRCATLLETMDSGTLSYMDKTAAFTDEKGIHYAKNLKPFCQDFGLVFQNFNLFPHFTVMKNITDAPIHIMKRNKAEVYEQAHLLLDKMGLTGKENLYPYQLSGGMQQRVSIVRALAMNPQILFFDEPTSALDPELTGEVLKVMRQLAEENMTMVIVTHEMDFARSVSDKVVFMDEGYVIEEGDPEEVFGNTRSERMQKFLSNYKK